MSKWSIGGQSQSQSGIARFMLTAYNPLFEPDIDGLHPVFEKLIGVRDLLAGRECLTDALLLPERFNACRVQIYPAGGGFMGGHKDTRAEASLSSVGDAYIQLVLLLTERGSDFHSGGAFVTVDGQCRDSEADSCSGDILVYNGATMHGVMDIDLDIAFDAHNLRGRAVALAIVYNYG